MGATVIEVGPPAHDDEKAALAFLAEGLPSSAVVFTNPWLVERSGAVYELDAVVAMPHAIYVVEIKGWTGHVRGGLTDWYLRSGTRRNPLKLARKTAQILHTLLQRRDADAGRVWTQEVVFLPAAASFRAEHDAVGLRVARRDQIHAVLHDEHRLRGLANRRHLAPVTPEVISELVALLKAPVANPPKKTIAGYTVDEVLDTNDRYREVLGRDGGGNTGILRIYRVPWNAPEAEQERVRKRATWEANVLRSFGRAPEHVRLPLVSAPIDTEEGVAVPMEPFEGVTLPTWLATHGAELPLRQRVDLWERIARTLAWTHERGVVHRHLAPETILVAEPPRPPERPDFQVTEFDLAKRVGGHTTVAWSEAMKERLEGAAPEVVLALSDAEPRSDQFSLGLILGLLATKQPLVPSTIPLAERRHAVPRLRDLDPDLPQRLEDAVARMVARRPTDRFASLDEAIAAVRAAFAAPVQPVARGLEPGARVGADYVVEDKLGEGGLAEVYRVKHKLLGERYALKVARPSETADRAIRREFFALRDLSHPCVVRAHDLTSMVADRTTLRLDFVEGVTLGAAIRDGRFDEGDLPTRQRLATDLFSALEAFEQARLLHLDLKPDNLMVRPDGRLVILDFSLARSPALDALTEKGELGEVVGGTWEWRDPAGVRAGPGDAFASGHGADRYSAAMCLFWLHAGRHPFDGRAPEPDEAPELDPAELVPPGLHAFFERALHPDPAQRFRSARAMREGYLSALGVSEVPPDPTAADLASDTPLQQTDLSPRAVRCLRAAQVRTVGELLGLPDDELGAVSGLGDRLLARVRAFRDDAAARGLEPRARAEREAPPFYQPLVHALDPLADLGLARALRDVLAKAGFRTVGDVARSTRPELTGLPGLGPARLGDLGRALADFHARRDTAGATDTLDGLWTRATRPLDDTQREVLAGCFGLHEVPRTQQALAAELGSDQARVSLAKTAGLERLDTEVLTPVVDLLDGILQQEHGIVPLDVAAALLTRELPAAGLRPEGVIRVVAALDTRAFEVLEIDSAATGEGKPLLVRPSWVTRDALRPVADAANRTTQTWPPTSPGAARGTLRGLLPDYRGDILQLAQWLVPTIATTPRGALYQPPVTPEQAVGWVLDASRDGLALDALRARVTETFGEHAPTLPEDDALLARLLDATWAVRDGRVVRADQLPEVARVEGDDVHEYLDLDTTISVADQVRDRLRGALEQGTSFRLVVAPPERHAEIAASLVAALPEAHGVSLADAWFRRHADTLERDARAARMPALKRVTAKKLDGLMDDLVAEHGGPRRTVVLHDTGLLGVLGGLEQIRLLYDRVQGGRHGLWIVVIPGVIHQRQPRFNEVEPVWHLPGFTLPLTEPLTP